MHTSVIRPHLEALEDRTLLSLTVLNRLDGLSSDDDPRYEPPDTDAAAGPDFIIETVNATVEFFEKSTGIPVSSERLEDFFSLLGPSPFVFDPVETYDEMAGRFFVAALDGHLESSYLDFAVSDSSNPLDGFHAMNRINLYETDSLGHPLFGDYPKLGFNADAYVITVNMVQADKTHDHVQVVTIDKSSVLNDDPGTLIKHQVDRVDSAIATMAAATRHGSARGGPMYFVTESTRFGGDALRVVEMTNVLSDSPTFADYDIPVPPYDAPPPAIDPGGTIDTIESFILNADWRGNRLVASHQVGSDGVSRVRWYEFDTGRAFPVLIQSGEINQGPQVHTYFSAIAVADNEDIGLTFMESSALEYVSMYITGRTAADPLGTMETPVAIYPGAAPYLGIRGGDYSAVTVDPVDGTFWAANMYKPFLAFWGTGIVNFMIAGRAAPLARNPRAVPMETNGASARPVAARWVLSVRDASSTPPGTEEPKFDSTLPAIPGDEPLQLAGTGQDIETHALPLSPQHAVVAEMIIHNRQRPLDGLNAGEVRQGTRHPEDDCSHEDKHFQTFPEGELKVGRAAEL
jgi:hypothetical protein